MAFFRSHILVCVDPECLARGAHDVIDALQDELVDQGLIDEIQVLETSRIGGCKDGPEMIVYPEGVHYLGFNADDVPFIVEEHFLKGRIVEKFREIPKVVVDEELGPLRPKEVRVVLKNCGYIDPTNIEDYLAVDGYQALGKALFEMNPEQVIEEVKNSGLRGRGGAGFPAARKWDIARKVDDFPKYMVCNADEGDPGAFMNRRVLEGDPHSVLEGMIIGAYAIGASYGYVYCRAEYPIAVETFNIAIAQAREFGFLGQNILGTDFSFDLEVRVGAGAFVCGEETALIASIMGLRGEPSPRPPFPAVKGVWGKPTNNNNVETYSNIPQIILKGADWYASMGTERSKGTKTFAVGGNVMKPGLIEVPMGITLREVINIYAKGMKPGSSFKMAQTGGSSGSIIPAALQDTPMDFESFRKAGVSLGSGALLICDQNVCIVDLVKVLLQFFRFESCGKCTPCRIGTQRTYEMVERISQGQGKLEELDKILELASEMERASNCGLGQTAAGPVRHMLQHFRTEVEAHIRLGICPTGVCPMAVEEEATPA